MIPKSGIRFSDKIVRKQKSMMHVALIDAVRRRVGAAGHRQKSLLDRRRAGFCYKLSRRRVGQDLAVIEHDDAIGVGHLVAQMRRPQHGDAAFGAQADDELEEFAAAAGVETDGRFVHQENARLVQQRARELQAAAVAAAQLRGLVVRALGKAEPRQLLLDARLGDGARNAVQSGMEQQIAGDRELEVEGGLLKHDAEHRQSRHRIAPHVVPHDLDAAGIGHEQPGQAAETAWSCRHRSGRAAR